MLVVEGNCVRYGGISGEGRGKVEKTVWGQLGGKFGKGSGEG